MTQTLNELLDELELWFVAFPESADHGFPPVKDLIQRVLTLQSVAQRQVRGLLFDGILEFYEDRDSRGQANFNQAIKEGLACWNETELRQMWQEAQIDWGYDDADFKDRLNDIWEACLVQFKERGGPREKYS